jgi:hypothetical protein
VSPPLILKRASASRSGGEWNDDDYDVLADGVVVGRAVFVLAVGERPLPWRSDGRGCRQHITPTHGYESTREAAMAAFAKSWRRE